VHSKWPSRIAAVLLVGLVTVIGVNTAEQFERLEHRAPTAQLADPGVVDLSTRYVCPGCAGAVRCGPPAYWRVADGLPVPPFSHPDGFPLCRDQLGRVMDPIPATY
jgi:hypothetical protein